MITVVFDSVIILLCLAPLIYGIIHRNRPRVGGKIGPVRTLEPRPSPPAGFSKVYARAMTLFVGGDATRFATLNEYLREGPRPRPVLMRVYRVAGCTTEIEIQDEPADYERIDAEEALALLRELPDLRRVGRLHLSDERSYFDAWVRRERGEDVVLLGNATNFRLIVLYRPDRRFRPHLERTLLHEWLHLVAFAAWFDLWRFGRAKRLETLSPLAVKPLNLGGHNVALHEAWCDLGERLLSRDENEARQAARSSPLQSIILWRRMERILRRTPPEFRSTRYDDWVARGTFMRAEIAPLASRAQPDAKSNPDSGIG